MTVPEAFPAAKSIAKDYTRLHLRIGWWSILVFLTLGLGLEWLHASKAPWYLNEVASTRRSMLTLAHAHGMLLGMGHVAFALSLSHSSPFPRTDRVTGSSLSGGGGGTDESFREGSVIVLPPLNVAGLRHRR